MAMYKFLRFVVAVVFLAGCGLTAQNLAVTNVQGESWLNHLARSFDETSMGKTGRLGPPEILPGLGDSRWESQPLSILATQEVTLRGADLYRLNCQGCHGESGLGAPPEINSVINPVRSTSVALIMERMKTVGMDASPVVAAEMAKQSRKAILLRLHQGGQDMPPFPHLSETEIRALMGYLKQLAVVPRAERDQESLRVSRIRIGEHLAKSTCHICHAATGANPNAEQLLQGAIPPLSALPARMNLSEFVAKVTQGAPVLMGSPPLLCRGRMPVFGYLSEDEAADVYLYLTLHPPESSVIAAAGVVFDGPSVPRGGSHVNHLPSAGDQEDAQPVSLVRFAFFPAVLFLVLGGVVVKCMPLAAKFQSGHVMSCAPSIAPVPGQRVTAPACLGGKMLSPALREPSNHTI
jgi:mono/diheme cytochrome c family protein